MVVATPSVEGDWSKDQSSSVDGSAVPWPSVDGSPAVGSSADRSAVEPRTASLTPTALRGCEPWRGRATRRRPSRRRGARGDAGRVMRIRRSTLASRCPEVSAVVGSGETTVVRWPWASNRTVVRKTKSSTSGENRMTWASEGGAGGVAGRRKTLTSASSSPGRERRVGRQRLPQFDAMGVARGGCQPAVVFGEGRQPHRMPVGQQRRSDFSGRVEVAFERRLGRSARLAPSPGLTSALGRASTRRATVTERSTRCSTVRMSPVLAVWFQSIRLIGSPIRYSRVA